MKFKLELPPRYDGTTNPIEFLQLYTTGIQATGGGAKVMANWFPMALKDPSPLMADEPPGELHRVLG